MKLAVETQFGSRSARAYLAGEVVGEVDVADAGRLDPAADMRGVARGWPEDRQTVLAAALWAVAAAGSVGGGGDGESVVEERRAA